MEASDETIEAQRRQLDPALDPTACPLRGLHPQVQRGGPRSGFQLPGLLAALKAKHWAGSIVSNVIVDSGIVHLWGEAGTQREIDACRALAQTIEGVRRISSHMVVVKTVV